MQTPTEIKSTIITFLFFKIEYNADLNSFVFKNRKPLNEIDEDYFELELGKIFKNIINNLQIGKENLLFLSDLEDIINKKTKHFEMFEMNSSNDVDVYLKYLKEEQFNKDFLFMLESNEEKTIEVDEANKSEFIRVFNLAKNYAYLLYQFVDGLIVDFDHIDFNEFDFDEYIKNYNIELFQEFSNQEKLKCLINYSKTDMANLFYLLLDEKIFHFSENERENKVKIQNFIEQNFLYKGKQDEIYEVRAINKEFSKVGYNGEEIQLKFLSDFRDMISLRIDKIYSKIAKK